MDDDYELVSKSELKNLKEENKQLKLQLESKKTIQVKENNETLSKEVLRILEDKFAEENNLIKKNLEDIRELNKNTLDVAINRMDDMNLKIGNLVDTFKDLLKSISILSEEVSKEDNSTLLDKLDSINKIGDMELKLKSIEEFMNNLKILLSQIKPTDMNFEKNITTQ